MVEPYLSCYARSSARTPLTQKLLSSDTQLLSSPFASLTSINKTVIEYGRPLSFSEAGRYLRLPPQPLSLLPRYVWELPFCVHPTHPGLQSGQGTKSKAYQRLAIKSSLLSIFSIGKASHQVSKKQVSSFLTLILDIQLAYAFRILSNKWALLRKDLYQTIP